MYNKLKEKLSTLQQSEGKIQEVNFKHNSINGKTVEAKIFLLGNKPKFEIKNISGYNPDYIKRKLRSELFTASILPKPKANDTIRVTKDLNIPMSENQRVTLSKGTRYFSVEDSPIDCNGALLPTTHEAIYLGKDNSKCLGHENAKWYKMFKLIPS